MAAVPYFAYGSNMRPRELERVCPSARLVGCARLPDHRLKFNRRSRRWQSGAADVVRDEGFSVWGALFTIDEADLPALDAQEGSGHAYRMVEETVVEPDGRQHLARLYTVIERVDPELRPSADYLEAMLSGASAVRLPDRYIAFLEYLDQERRRAEDGEFRGGLLVRATTRRAEARGIGLARIHPQEPANRGLGGAGVVVLHDRAVVAEIVKDTRCTPGTVELDQSVRHAVGVPGRESYGFDVELARVRGRVQRSRLLHPRMLALPVWPPSWLDSEKQIAVLHPNTVRLLGLAEGDSIRISAAVRADGLYDLRSISRRVLCGSAPEVHRHGKTRPYPDPAEVYLDLDARNWLGIGQEGYPVWISADVRRLVVGRVVLYGLTLFLATAGLDGLLQPIGKSVGLGSAGAALVALGLAALLTLVVVFFDLRAKIHY